MWEGEQENPSAGIYRPQACVATHGLIGLNELMGVRYCYYHQIIEIILNDAKWRGECNNSWS
jgi:hypothetical protein